METPGHFDDRTSAEERRDARGIERRRHHDDSQVGVRQPCLPAQREPEIGMNAPLVELVEDDRSEARQERVLLQPRREYALGRDENPGAIAELPFEPDVPADLAPDRPALLRRDPPRDRSCRDAARLQNDRRPVRRQRRRHARRLARAGRRREHERPIAPDRGDDVGKEGIDGKG